MIDQSDTQEDFIVIRSGGGGSLSSYIKKNTS